jgi:hypothetical protein
MTGTATSSRCWSSTYTHGSVASANRRSTHSRTGASSSRSARTTRASCVVVSHCTTHGAARKASLLEKPATKASMCATSASACSSETFWNRSQITMVSDAIATMVRKAWASANARVVRHRRPCGGYAYATFWCGRVMVVVPTRLLRGVALLEGIEYEETRVRPLGSSVNTAFDAQTALALFVLCCVPEVPYRTLTAHVPSLRGVSVAELRAAQDSLRLPLRRRLVCDLLAFARAQAGVRLWRAPPPCGAGRRRLPADLAFTPLAHAQACTRRPYSTDGLSDKTREAIQQYARHHRLAQDALCLAEVVHDGRRHMEVQAGVVHVIVLLPDDAAELQGAPVRALLRGRRELGLDTAGRWWPLAPDVRAAWRVARHKVPWAYATRAEMAELPPPRERAGEALWDALAARAAACPDPRLVLERRGEDTLVNGRRWTDEDWRWLGAPGQTCRLARLNAWPHAFGVLESVHVADDLHAAVLGDLGLVNGP